MLDTQKTGILNVCLPLPVNFASLVLMILSKISNSPNSENTSLKSYRMNSTLFNQKERQPQSRESHIVSTIYKRYIFTTTDYPVGVAKTATTTNNMMDLSTSLYNLNQTQVQHKQGRKRRRVEGDYFTSTEINK